MGDHFARPDRGSIPALRWEEPPEGPVLVLLDQTRLPQRRSSWSCTDVQALVAAIRSLAVRGAPLLGLAGAYGVALAAARGYDVEDAAELLAQARPTAVNLGYGVRRAAGRRYREAAPEEAAAAALAEARALHAQDAAASAAMAEHGERLLAELVPGGGYRMLTHCNTGALVSGGEGTALGVVLAAHRAGELRRLWVDETRPLLQGARLTAYEAARAGMPYTLLADNAAGSLFAAGEVDAVLIGADRIAADGSTANKVGSYPLAVLARHHHVPFIVVAPTTTVDLEHAGRSVDRGGAAGGQRGDGPGAVTAGDAGVQPGVRRHAAGADHGDRHRERCGLAGHRRAADGRLQVGSRATPAQVIHRLPEGAAEVRTTVDNGCVA